MTTIFDQTLLGFLQCFATLFFAILFGQSAADKLLSFKGNQAYIQSYFEQTPLRHFSKFLFVVLVVLEALTAILCIAGLFCQINIGMKDVAIAGLLLANLSIIALFFGNRMAKDYAASANMTIYFLASLLSVLLFSLKG